MTKRAIDIVLLLPDEVRQEAIRLNQMLDTREIDFTENDIHPHISLLMGCLEEKDRERTESILEEIARDRDPLPLQIKRIVNNGSVSFEIEKTAALQDLHEHLIARLQPHLSYAASADLFYKPEEVKENAVDYVSNFIHQASYGHFWPHITLGYGDFPEQATDLAFTASRLALCHLGKHCTCRDLLKQTRLN
jgi:2'-5' RNA ligase